MSKPKTKPPLTEDELRSYAKDLQNTLSLTGLSLEAWWGVQVAPHLARVQNRYPAFFQCSQNAHFTAFIIGFYRLFETSPNTYSIPSFILRLRDEGKVAEAKLNEFQAAYETLKPAWVKVSILRNKVFGHRAQGHSIQDVFQQANVTPDQFMALYQGMARLLNDMTMTRLSELHAFNLGSKAEVIRMHEDLAKALVPAEPSVD